MTATPKTFTFNFVTAAGWQYPVTVSFTRHLPNIQFVNVPDHAVRAVWNRDILHHVALPDDRDPRRKRRW